MPLGAITGLLSDAAHESYCAASEIVAHPIEMIRMKNSVRTECADMAAAYRGAYRVSVFVPAAVSGNRLLRTVCEASAAASLTSQLCLSFRFLIWYRRDSEGNLLNALNYLLI